MKKLLPLFFLLPFLTQAQKSPAKKILKEIEYGQDSIKAVYDWVTKNIRYDVNKLQRIKKQNNKPRQIKAKGQQTRINGIVNKVLQVRQGVCEDYSYLFDAIVKELGYESFVVTGYSKKPNSKVTSKIGHAWNAVKVNGTWKLFDTTWGAGMVKDEKKFIKKYSSEWYDVAPSEMIKTHIPYDPIWQLLEKPISYEDFKFDRFDTGTNTMDFNKVINTYFQQDKQAQITGELNRSKTMGEGVGLVKRWRMTQSRNLKSKAKISGLNQSVDQLNEVISTFNQYNAARKKRFKDDKWTIDYSKQQLPILKNQLESILSDFRRTSVKGDKNKRSKKKNIDTIRKMMKHIEREVQFLKKL